MTGEENRAMVEAIWQSTAERLSVYTGQPLRSSYVRAALAAALAKEFGERGGVMIVWWDAEGLKVNAAPYGESR